jgi:hypothetical protein
LVLFVALAAAKTVDWDFSTLMDFMPKNITGKKYCATEDIWRWKKSQLSKKTDEHNCPTEGICDIPAIRNLWSSRQMTIGVVFNLVCPTVGQGNCAIGDDKILAQLVQMNNDFQTAGITFQLIEINKLYNSALENISPYGNNNQWYFDIRSIKASMAVKPDEYLNVFMSRQRAGLQGTLLGIGTFPWDPEAPGVYGGLWVNALYVGAGETTAAHEVGHNVGLWHTFHGTAEVSCASQCYEGVHNETDDTSFPNTVGDFCADTLSQPVNYACSVPTSSDCRGVRYNNIELNLYPYLVNYIMSYTPDNFHTQLTQQQAMISHCWVCDRLPNWVDSETCQL